ncbi:MAG: hypothetical protein DIZ77_11335 [endosymbiont of Seepiophila jonesi]|uniref:Uncharacterized protein n=1 Tax=endosymbiont of Lamellibrachia luymesi TaxID=2200907 RepID=A0A370E1N1_9GAMM|nr:MAG: hypothetical protein DIZ77_11335 [endosymbiont of Seepiophila jonesi]RDH93569.1 MAG: hypothetical protein DIZ79_00035 [endosymbiont of Lamellibrachia luymesi]
MCLLGKVVPGIVVKNGSDFGSTTIPGSCGMRKECDGGASRFHMAPLLDFNMTGAGAGSIDLRGQTLAYSPGGEDGSSSTPAASKASFQDFPWLWAILGATAAGLAISCANDQWPCFKRDDAVSGDSVPPDDYVPPPEEPT